MNDAYKLNNKRLRLWPLLTFEVTLYELKQKKPIAF
jgi:hypothetical protein